MYGKSLSECLLRLLRLVLCLRSGFYLYTMIWTIPLQYLMGWKRKLFLFEILARNLLPSAVYSFVHISILQIRYLSAIPPIFCAVSRLSSLYPLDILEFSKKYSFIHPLLLTIYHWLFTASTIVSQPLQPIMQFCS